MVYFFTQVCHCRKIEIRASDFCLTSLLLSHTEACLWEATRLGVTLPISLAHTVTKETTLRGFTVPRDNACVIANLYAGNRLVTTRAFPKRHAPPTPIDVVVSQGIPSHPPVCPSQQT